MKITPVDITNKDFKRTMRGYSTDEVDEFLDEVVEDFEALYRENANLKERLETFNEKIEHYGSLEKTLQSTLVLAQSTADSTKQQAEREAESILESAKDKAAQLLAKANEERESILREYERYRMEFTNYRHRVLSFMGSQLSSFEELSQEIDRGTLASSSMNVKGLSGKPENQRLEMEETGVYSMDEDLESDTPRG